MGNSAMGVAGIALIAALAGCETVPHPEALIDRGLSPIIALDFDGEAMGSAADGVTLVPHRVVIQGIGRSVKAGSFNGLSWVDVRASEPIELRKFTIATRLRSPFPKYWQAIFNANSYDYGGALHFQFPGNVMEAAVAGNYSKIPLARRFYADSWYDILFIYDADEHTATYFVDGKKASEQESGGIRATVTIGEYQVGNWLDNDRAFVGLMDYFYLFEGIPDEEAIAAYYARKAKR